MQGDDIEKKSGMKKIDIDTLEKIVSKIKNILLHHMITMYDMVHKNDVPKDDIEIIEVNQQQGEGSQISNTPKRNDSTVDAYKNQFRPLLSNGMK
jgi:hypothetical protein